MRECRFLVADLSGRTAVLDQNDQHHAIRVLRLAVGDVVTLFDGCGQEAEARIESIGGDGVLLNILGPARPAPVPRIPLTLAVAVPKGDRADWMVEKCGEFGVARLDLIRTARGVVEPGAGKLARWRRKAVEAAKQARSPVVMEISAGRTLSDVLESCPPRARVFYGTTQGEAVPLASQLATLAAESNPPGALISVIGPEGGFTDEEIELLASGAAEAVTLGPTVLRVETAALSVAALWSGICR